MSDKFYIYEYFYPESNIPFYIGKGTDNRIISHIIETEHLPKREYTGKHKIIEKLLKQYSPSDFIRYTHKNLTEHEALSGEAELIDKYGLQNLTNKVNGLIETKRCPVPQMNITIYSQEEYNKYLYESRLKVCNYIFKNCEFLSGGFIFSDGFNIRKYFDDIILDVLIYKNITTIRLSTKNKKKLKKINTSLSWLYSETCRDFRLRSNKIKFGWNTTWNIILYSLLIENLDKQFSYLNHLL